MITPSGQSGWAERLQDALDDTTTSLSTTVLWLQSNVGHLNSLIGTDYGITGNDSGVTITGDWGSFESGIYNELYFCSYLHKKSRTMVGAMEYDWKEMEGEDQGKVKVITKTEKSKLYKELAESCDTRITKLVKTYKGGGFAPVQILYNRRNSSTTTGMHSPPYPFSEINFSV